MSDKFQNKYRIPSARLQNWDYGSNGMYFVTICTEGRECYFGNVVNGKMELSPVGIIANILWHEIKNHVKDIELGEFVVMPNHIHGIIIIDKPLQAVETLPMTETLPAVETLHATSLQQQQQQQPLHAKNEFMANISPKPDSLSTIIRSYKSAVSKHAHRLGFGFAWQSRFHDHIIRNDESFQQISNYIIDNPSKWTDDKFFQ